MLHVIIIPATKANTFSRLIQLVLLNSLKNSRLKNAPSGSAMPLMLAWWFQRREGQMRSLDFFVAGLILVIPVGLIVSQPDLGTSLLVLASGGTQKLKNNARGC